MTTDRKIFLGFEPKRLSETFSYVMRDLLVRRFYAEGIPFTFDPSDDYDECVFASAEDMMAYYPRISKKAKVTVYPLLDPWDFVLSKDGKVVLSDVANIYYKLADRLVVGFQSQIEYLLGLGFEDKIVYEPYKPTYDPASEISDAERKAFRSYYRIEEDMPVILSFGIGKEKEEFQILDSISRVNPDKKFIYSGDIDSDSFKMPPLVKRSEEENISFLKTIPEELYRSSLYAVDALLIVHKHPSDVNLLVDYKVFNTKIISYGMIGLEDFVNPSTASVPRNFRELDLAVKGVVSKSRR